MSTTRRSPSSPSLGVSAASAACGSGGSDDAAGCGGSKTVTLVSHDSFAASKDGARGVHEQTGYTVRVLRGGDAGAAVNQAILTKDNPQGDVFFGVDNTLLSRALDNGLFQPRTGEGPRPGPARVPAGPGKHRVTPGRHR